MFFGEAVLKFYQLLITVGFTENSRLYGSVMIRFVLLTCHDIVREIVHVLWKILVILCIIYN